VAFQVADRHSAPAVGGADHGGEHEFERGFFLRMVLISPGAPSLVTVVSTHPSGQQTAESNATSNGPSAVRTRPGSYPLREPTWPGPRRQNRRIKTLLEAGRC
jgi:hypothetical protein